MAERKRNIKYFFTVEGDCEDWYLGHLQKLINNNEKSLCTVQIERVITRELEKTAKTINPVTVPQTLYHLCDVEGIDVEDQTRFQTYLQDLKTVKKQKGIQYDLGYSNFSFELWMILHKQACNGCLTYKKEYLSLINKAYDENFSSLKSYKNKDNFKNCLDKIDLLDIKMAVTRAKDIMAMRKRNGDKEISLYAFYNIIDDNIVENVVVDELAYKGFGYYGSGTFIEQVQNVSYSTKSTESYTIPYDLPNYFGVVNDVTGCANNAGACIIGYYDRFYENLIPNYKSYVQIGNVIRYRTGTPEVFDLVEELYVLMGTDVSHLGTTFSEFQAGMLQYVANKGYTYSTTSLFTNGSFNIDNYKFAVQNGKPVALFMTGYALLNGITEETNMDTISSGYSANTHVMVGCGYKIDKYYNSNGALQETRTYLRVASGSDIYGIGYLNINALGQMDRAISVTIN